MKEYFGKNACGNEAYLYTLRNTNGMLVKISNYGGIVHTMSIPDKDGNFDDILLGCKDFDGYLSPENPYFNCIVGRVCNRVSNAGFRLDGVFYRLAANAGPNQLHGGLKGFDKVFWDVSEFSTDNGSGLEFTYLSPDGEEGYPGNLKVKVTYLLTDANEFVITYRAETDKATPVNLTHHAYFNLLGQNKGSILDHQLKVWASAYTETDENLIPTGTICNVDHTPFDFRQMKSIGLDIEETGIGYDFNFVLDGTGMRKVAELIEPVSKRKMEVLTDSPGMQLYTGNFLNTGIKAKQNGGYQKHEGLCLETQYFPDSPNIAAFPNCILRPGKTFKHQTIYRFSIIS
jgi:aldose 1-epimerase